jgi:hypothetical protein
MYAFKNKGKWEFANLQSRFHGVGAFHTLTDEERAKHGFYPCVVINEQYDRLRENRTSEPLSWELNDNVVTATYQVTSKPLSQALEEKRSELKELREKEVAEPINNVQVGRIEARENIQGAIDRFDTLAPSGVIGWVMADNSIGMLTKAQLEQIADGYVIRKAQVFNKYGMLCLALNEAETIEDIIAIEW